MEIQTILEREIVQNKIRVEFKSEASENHPNRNEDGVFIDKQKQIFGVFDGVGGEKHGEIASQNCVSQFKENSKEIISRTTTDDAMDFLAGTFNQANKKNFEEGIKSTAVAGIICEEEKSMIIANVGDSRAYLYRDGALNQITIDDNLVSRENGYGKKTKELQNKLNNVLHPEKELNETEQEIYNRRNEITTCIGVKEVQTKFYSIEDLKQGDKILFCTDGISDNLTDNQISRILKEDDNEAYYLTEIAKKVSKNGSFRSKMDDMSAIVVIL